MCKVLRNIFPSKDGLYVAFVREISPTLPGGLGFYRLHGCVKFLPI